MSGFNQNIDPMERKSSYIPLLHCWWVKCCRRKWNHHSSGSRKTNPRLNGEKILATSPNVTTGGLNVVGVGEEREVGVGGRERGGVGRGQQQERGRGQRGQGRARGRGSRMEPPPGQTDIRTAMTRARNTTR